MIEERYPGEREGWEPGEHVFFITDRNDYDDSCMFPSMEGINDIAWWVGVCIWDSLHHLDA